MVILISLFFGILRFLIFKLISDIGIFRVLDFRRCMILLVDGGVLVYGVVDERCSLYFRFYLVICFL